jgi:hypothetical protein
MKPFNKKLTGESKELKDRASAMVMYHCKIIKEKIDELQG